MEAGTMQAQPPRPQTEPEAENDAAKDVSFDQAKAEQGDGGNEGPPPSPNANADVVDILQPKSGAKLWKFGPNGELEYIQKPLSFIGKMEWFSLVGDVLDKAMGGENPLTVNALMQAPGARGTLSVDDFRDADMFVHAVGKLIKEAPNFLIDSYNIWLNVPIEQRDIVARLMKQSPEDGGLTDDDGIEMIEIFVDQNYEALDDFFRHKVGGLRARVQARTAALAEARSQQSKR